MVRVVQTPDLVNKLGVAFAFAMILHTTRARAEQREQDVSPWLDDLGLFGAGFYAARWNTMPAFRLEGADAPRRLVGLASPAGPGPTGYGFEIDFLRERLGPVLLSEWGTMRWSFSGQGPSGIAIANGAPVRVAVDSLRTFDFDMFSLGGQLLVGPFKITGLGRVGFAWSQGSATFTDASGAVFRGTIAGPSHSSEFGGELATCVRIARLSSPEKHGRFPKSLAWQSWGCLSGSMTVYSFGANTMNLGARIDL